MNNKLFIAGRSGTGKTYTGNQLQQHHQWKHFDCEHFHKTQPSDTFQQFLDNPLQHIPNKPNTVITWGYLPQYYPTVQKIIAAGYTPIWLEGTPQHRQKLLQQRGEPPEWINNPIHQLTDIAKQQHPNWTEIQAFHPNGTPRNLTKLLTQNQ
jgi:shikimate kinase